MSSAARKPAPRLPRPAARYWKGKAPKGADAASDSDDDEEVEEQQEAQDDGDVLIRDLGEGEEDEDEDMSSVFGYECDGDDEDNDDVLDSDDIRRIERDIPSCDKTAEDVIVTGGVSLFFHSTHSSVLKFVFLSDGRSTCRSLGSLRVLWACASMGWTDRDCQNGCEPG